MKKRKGKPFLEVLSSTLHEDYRFPILEIFVFLYVLGTFAFANFGGVGTSQEVSSGEVVAYRLATSLLGAGAGISVVLFILVIVILKNIAYGLGNDLERGIIQTYFSYPLKRHKILTAKLLSALVVSVLLFLGVQILGLYMLAPDVVSPHLSIVLLAYAANLSFPLIVAGILLLVTLILKRGGPALVIGIVLVFSFFVSTVIFTSLAFGTESPLPLQILSVFSPQIALQQYYPPASNWSELWSPTFSQVLLYVGASYAIVAVLFGVGYYYFSRRLNV